MPEDQFIVICIYSAESSCFVSIPSPPKGETPEFYPESSGFTTVSRFLPASGVKTDEFNSPSNSSL